VSTKFDTQSTTYYPTYTIHHILVATTHTKRRGESSTTCLKECC
jgi:hypothetical protein